MNYDSLKALAAQIFYLRNASEEMTDYGDFDVRWPEELQGLRLLGAGCFGAAYELPDGRVLKVGKITDGTSLWISEAAKHFTTTGKPMRHAPRVWAFDTIQYEERQWREVFITAEPSVRAERYKWTDVGYYVLPVAYVPVDSTVKTGWWAIMERVESEQKRADAAGEVYGDLSYLIREQVCAWANRLEDSLGIRLNDDMHVGNWGRSVETGRIVVFDPFCGRSTAELRSTYVEPGSVPNPAKKIPPHRMVRHAGPTKGRWARG